MKNIKKNTTTAVLFALFTGIPLSLYFLGDFPRRTNLMEAISISFIITFSLLISQFFTNRLNRKLVKKIRMVNVLSIHKFIGYVFATVILLHPFLIVTPKFFDQGVSPSDAFLKIITTFNNNGVVLGFVAYLILLILLITSFFRFKLHLKYRTWRNLHGYLSIFFIITAVWHAVAIGRHSSIPIEFFYIITSSFGAFLVVKTYFFNPSKSKK